MSCMPIDYLMYLATNNLDFSTRVRMLRLLRTKEVAELTPYWNHFMGVLSTLLPVWTRMHFRQYRLNSWLPSYLTKAHAAF